MAGVIIAGVGLIPGAEPLLPIGGTVMAAGSTMNLGGAIFQLTGGLAQMAGDFDTGSRNAMYGALNIGTAISFAQVSSRAMSAGRTVNQRLFNSELKAGITGAGFGADVINFLSPDTAPRQANCSTP